MKKFCYVIAPFLFFVLTSHGQSVNPEIALGVRQVNSGKLSDASATFMKITSSTDKPNIDVAIAHKHLGTANLLLGNEFLNNFNSSEVILNALIKQFPDNRSYQDELGLLLYQRANSLLFKLETVLSQLHLKGITPVPFEYFRDFISPAQEDLNLAMKCYPQNKVGDIELLQSEIVLAEARLLAFAKQDESAIRAYKNALTVIDSGINRAESSTNKSSDSLKKLYLRKSNCLAELNILIPKSVDPAKIIETIKQAVKIDSGNIELDSSAICLLAKFVLDNSTDVEKEFPNIEKALQDNAEKLEKRRTGNVITLDFSGRKGYFLTRTGVYEALVMYYAKINNPEKMLNAIEAMKARAFKELCGENFKDENQSPLVLSELHLRLKVKNAGVVCYFVGNEKIWSIWISPYSCQIRELHLDAQKTTKLIENVISVFSNSTHLKMYYRFKEQYLIVPRAYQDANILYNELLLPELTLFNKEKLSSLYIAPHHLMNYLPFGALVDKLNKEDIMASSYVADSEIPISYLPTLSLLMQNNPVTTNHKHSVVFARSDFTTYLPKYPSDLPNAVLEAKKVSSVLNDSTLLVEKDATESYLFNNLAAKNASVIHIASHAHLNKESPMESYVLLAADDNDDGKITVEELVGRYRGRLHSDLVVLSACDTNRGETNPQSGDDLATLSRGFIIAGTKGVIATQWPASDETFPVIMEKFYIIYAKEKLSKDIALAKALKKYLTANSGIMRSPIFWGNIILISGE